MIDTAGKSAPSRPADELDEVRFTLRAAQHLFSRIDAARRQRPGFVSRNTWVLEAISEKLQRELLGTRA